METISPSLEKCRGQHHAVPMYAYLEHQIAGQKQNAGNKTPELSLRDTGFIWKQISKTGTDGRHQKTGNIICFQHADAVFDLAFAEPHQDGNHGTTQNRQKKITQILLP